MVWENCNQNFIDFLQKTLCYMQFCTPGEQHNLKATFTLGPNHDTLHSGSGNKLTLKGSTKSRNVWLGEEIHKAYLSL